MNPYKDPEFITLQTAMRESNCCTVVALWCCTGISLDQCFTFMKKHGRAYRKGITKSAICVTLEQMKKFKAVKGPYGQKNKITVGQFILKHPVGIYYATNNGHAFCIRNGEIHDHTEGLKRQITLAYRIYTPEEIINLN